MAKRLLSAVLGLSGEQRAGDAATEISATAPRNELRNLGSSLSLSADWWEAHCPVQLRPTAMGSRLRAFEQMKSHLEEHDDGSDPADVVQRYDDAVQALEAVDEQRRTCIRLCVPVINDAIKTVLQDEGWIRISRDNLRRDAEERLEEALEPVEAYVTELLETIDELNASIDEVDAQTSARDYAPFSDAEQIEHFQHRFTHAEGLRRRVADWNARAPAPGVIGRISPDVRPRYEHIRHTLVQVNISEMEQRMRDAMNREGLVLNRTRLQGGSTGASKQ